MRFVRFAIAHFNPSLPAPIKDGITSNDVSIQISTLPGEAVSDILIIANMELKEMPQIIDGGILIDKSIHKIINSLIEFVADVIAVSNQSSRRISSPSPFAGFVDYGDEEATWLSNTKGFKANLQAGVAHPPLGFPYEYKMLENLSDRLMGVVLMAEALTANHSASKFRDYIRLFEAAFSLPASQLGKKLNQFLSPRLQYERSEIEGWLSKRDGASHADGRKTTEIVIEADVQRLIPRIEQAAYDVLLNKKVWGDRSSERRELWRSDSAITGQVDVLGTVGKDFKMTFSLLDPFGHFPLNLTYDLNQIAQLPPDFWSEWSNRHPVNSTAATTEEPSS